LLLGKSDASTEQLEGAIRQAYLQEVLQQLPHGIDTLIGERGVKLSGGERQRVAIARAILKDAPVIVLDEATSALDNLSESVIRQALQQLTCNRTVIMIAHRLSSIQSADRIVVMEAGQIVQMGLHANLLEDRGHYRDLYEAQFQQ
jgi:ABC-type multidrug transport system fused ATPase/permease subunit